MSACFENAIPSSLSESQSVICDAFDKLHDLRKLLLSNGKIESDEDAKRLSQFTSAIASRIVLRFVLGVLKLRSRLRVQVWKKFKLKSNQIGTWCSSARVGLWRSPEAVCSRILTECYEILHSRFALEHRYGGVRCRYRACAVHE